MFHLNRKSEYALIAIEHMAQKALGAVTSVREVAEAHHVPYAILAKVLQSLARQGLIRASQGTKGGYALTLPPEDISVARVMAVFEGPMAVAECFKETNHNCPQSEGCRIKRPLQQLQGKIYELLSHTMVAQLAAK